MADRCARPPLSRRICFQDERPDRSVDRRSRLEDYDSADCLGHDARRYDDRPGDGKDIKTTVDTITVLRRQWRGGFRRRSYFRGRGQLPSTDVSNGRWRSELNSDIYERCGQTPHNHPNNCPATNQHCNGCGLRGHYVRFCRTAARRQTTSD